jgi:hypothetical protein
LGRDEVHNGVGMIYGPWGCVCGWSEWSEWDSTKGPAKVEADHPGYHADSRGGLTSKLWLETFAGIDELDNAPFLSTDDLGGQS